MSYNRPFDIFMLIFFGIYLKHFLFNCFSFPASTLASLEQLARSSSASGAAASADAMAAAMAGLGQRPGHPNNPFGLPKPFGTQGLPEDLTRKVAEAGRSSSSPPVSPPKFSPEPPAVSSRSCH